MRRSVGGCVLNSAAADPRGPLKKASSPIQNSKQNARQRSTGLYNSEMTVVVLVLAAALAQQPPAPQPFPRPGASQPARPAQPPPAKPGQPGTTPATPTAAPSSTAAPTEVSLGVPLYPGAQFIASYDAGRGQRFYLYGSTA